MIQANNMPVTMISKKLSQGQPNIIDIIINGTVDGVVNTVTGGRVVLKDGFEIRRAAAEKRLPYFTSLDTINAVLKALTSRQSYTTAPLPEYRRGKYK
jgi:carbamoyl-phosphate synthase large subunit